tara:strand:- start:531 stop:935 length:405 start_codon:yes stop_codon:yes gene_type:complete
MDSKTKEILQKFSSQKVELGAVQDFNKKTSNFKQTKEKTEKAISECLRDLRNFNDLQQDVKQSYKRAKSLIDSAENDIKDIDKSAQKVAELAKELGVQPSTLIETVFVNFITSLEGSIQNFKSNEDIAKKISNL